VRLLLVSQVVFWVMTEEPRLTPKAVALLADPANLCLMSPISHWEMAMKISVGKYESDGDFQAMWRDATARFAVLPIEPRHTAWLIDMPFHHKDPFDRMVIAQALGEGIPLVSTDRQLDAYGVRRLW
jgi:PIN domain nuclease of toxin-antitoxin system